MTLERQNDPEQIELLAAQRVLYSRAKRVHLFKILGTLVLAAVAPIVLHLVPAWGPSLGAVAGLCIFVSRIALDGFEQRLQRRAALVQEEFDTRVLGLPWNRALGRRVAHEDVTAAARKYSDRSDLRDWYPIPQAAGIARVLICQRTNAVWGRRQHVGYGWFIAGAGVAWTVVGILIAIATDATLAEYLVAILLPSLPALLDASDRAKGHLSASTARGELEAAIDDDLGTPGSSLDNCRHFQDQIFHLRANAPQIPDWWYRLFRKTYDADATAAADAISNELRHRNKNG
ncbi:MAG: S-4TM family putative pore-forming effector [Actinomycetota bacterium]|nr:S-4TM family putative pore-forming effector [Actinomycetota bacterium]